MRFGPPAAMHSLSNMRGAGRRMRPLLERLSRLGILSVASLILFQGCLAAPRSQAYGPHDADEQQLFSLARRDIFPRDVRAEPERYRSQLVLWSGVIVGRRVRHAPEGDVLELLIEHHYWDWTEHYEHGGENVFLSPRGEGLFGCSFPSSDTHQEWASAEEHEMAIVYGVPDGITDDGVVQLHCAVLRSLRQEFYTTAARNYGRDWLLKGDGNDLKVLGR